MGVVNPFEIEGESKRYHQFRPQYHHIPFNKLREFKGQDFKFSLDVACGTGHSTNALSKISKKIIGCDLSNSMLKEARVHYEVEFINASAEKLPFVEPIFDLINISMGFHWLNQEEFLLEAKRVLSPGGLLSIDNYGFSGKISDISALQKAHSDLFENHLPQAKRNSGYPTEAIMNSVGLKLVQVIPYDHLVGLNAYEFANLIMTWSNFQALDDSEKISTSKKMHEVYEMIFEGKSLDLPFAGKMIVYQFG